MTLTMNDLKNVKKIELEILLELDRICKKEKINYQLFAGTLLGSIRHQGFIPWDDDIDVCMLRRDYERFVKVCENGTLNEAYFLQTNKTDPLSVVQFAKIRKNGTVFENINDCNQSTHTGIFIDIFPLDNVLPFSIKGRIQYRLFDFWYKVVSSSDINRVKNAKNVANKVFRLFFWSISKLIGKRRIDDKLYYIATRFNGLNTEYVNHLTNGTQGKRMQQYLRKRDSVCTSTEGVFEGYKFPIPVDYDEVLKRLYGDYLTLPPENQRVPGHKTIRVKC